MLEYDYFRCKSMDGGPLINRGNHAKRDKPHVFFAYGKWWLLHMDSYKSFNNIPSMIKFHKFYGVH